MIIDSYLNILSINQWGQERNECCLLLDVTLVFCAHVIWCTLVPLRATAIRNCIFTSRSARHRTQWTAHTVFWIKIKSHKVSMELNQNLKRTRYKVLRRLRNSFGLNCRYVNEGIWLHGFEIRSRYKWPLNIGLS